MNESFDDRLKAVPKITLAQAARSAILVAAFATFAAVLLGRDLEIIGLTVAIGVLLSVLTEGWRLPHDG